MYVLVLGKHEKRNNDLLELFERVHFVFSKQEPKDGDNLVPRIYRDNDPNQELVYGYSLIEEVADGYHRLRVQEKLRAHDLAMQTA